MRPLASPDWTPLCAFCSLRLNFNYVYVGGGVGTVRVGSGAHGGHELGIPQELESQGAVSHLIWVLGT